MEEGNPRGVLESVAERVATMVRRVSPEPEVVLVGGLARSRTFAGILSEALEVEVTVSPARATRRRPRGRAVGDGAGGLSQRLQERLHARPQLAHVLLTVTRLQSQDRDALLPQPPLDLGVFHRVRLAELKQVFSPTITSATRQYRQSLETRNPKDDSISGHKVPR